MSRHWRRLIGATGIALTIMTCVLAQPQPSSRPTPGNPHRADSPASGSSNRPALALGRNGQHDSTGDDVLTIVDPSGDTTRVVEYTPAPGLSADLLAARLGVDTEANGGRPTMAPASYSQCSYAYLGTAKTLCPMLHWTNAGYADPQVYYVDHTSGAWPV